MAVHEIKVRESMVEVVTMHKAKPSVLWPIESSLEYLYERTARPFRALIDLLYRGLFKSNDQERSRCLLGWLPFLAMPWVGKLSHGHTPTWATAGLAEP